MPAASPIAFLLKLELLPDPLSHGVPCGMRSHAVRARLAALTIHKATVASY
jgi:hypothetical protein